MTKMTVSDYARLKQKSVQAIYQAISANKIKYEKVGKKTFVYVDEPEQTDIKSSSNELLKLEVEMLKELLKSKESEIETLKASLNVFTVVFNNRLNEKPTISEAEIVEDRKKKKKKKKK